MDHSALENLIVDDRDAGLFRVNRQAFCKDQGRNGEMGKRGNG